MDNLECDHCRTTSDDVILVTGVEPVAETGEFIAVSVYICSDCDGLWL